MTPATSVGRCQLSLLLDSLSPELLLVFHVTVNTPLNVSTLFILHSHTFSLNGTCRLFVVGET